MVDGDVAADGASYWQTRAGVEYPPPSGGLTLDVAVVGGGIGGLAAAWHLHGRGLSVAVLEAGTLAGGASGRNGGFLIAGAAPMYNDAREMFGPALARRIYAATLAAQQEVYSVADDIGAGDAFRRVGMLRLAVDQAEAAHVRAHASALAEDGFPGTVVEEADLPRPLQRPGRAGLLTEHDASVHPVWWLRALAHALADRGVAIHEGTPATLRPDGLATAAGPVRAGAVVVAADAAAGRLVPAYATRIRPRRLHMIATGPLSERHVRRPVYARYGYEYHQQLPDGTLLLGGFSDLDGAASYTDRPVGSARVFARLERYLAEDLALRAPVKRRWVGIVGYTDDARPYVGAVPGADGLFVMGGYCGTGNLCAWVGGRVVAEILTTGASADADLFDAAR